MAAESLCDIVKSLVKQNKLGHMRSCNNQFAKPTVRDRLNGDVAYDEEDEVAIAKSIDAMVSMLDERYKWTDLHEAFTKEIQNGGRIPCNWRPAPRNYPGVIDAELQAHRLEAKEEIRLRLQKEVAEHEARKKSLLDECEQKIQHLKRQRQTLSRSAKIVVTKPERVGEKFCWD